MGYEYIRQHFKRPSDALNSYQDGVALFIRYDNDFYTYANIETIIDNHMNLFTRKKNIIYKTIDKRKHTLSHILNIIKDAENTSILSCSIYEYMVNYKNSIATIKSYIEDQICKED